MWIFTTKGFYDLVTNRDRKGWMIIKARCEADIWNLYNEHHGEIRMSQPVTDPLWDYRWGIHIGKNNAQRLVAQLASEIDYSLFKGAVHKNPTQEVKTQPYLRIWGIMLGVQTREEYGDGQPEPKESWLEDELLPEQQWRSSRFDDLEPVPTKTIRSVVRNGQ